MTIQTDRYAVLALVILMFPAVVGADADSTSFYYIGTASVHFDKEDSSLIHNFNSVELDMRGKTITLDDAVLPLDICPVDSDWYCLYGGGIYFSVAKKESKDTSSYKGFDFQDTGKEDLVLFGQHHQVEIITARRSGELPPKTAFVAYYSKEEGLLGFTFKWFDPDVTETYLLTGAKGYGASQKR